MAKQYYFRMTCCYFEDGNEVYDLTRADEYANNEFCIDDESLNDGTIKILTKEEFDKLVPASQPRPNNITFYAQNTDYDILYIYDEKDDLHWFYYK